MADTNVEVKLKDVRLSFDNLFEPQGQKSDKTGELAYSYNCVFLLDKDKHADQIKAIQDAMIKARDLKWPGQEMKIPAERRCMRDGEPADPDTGVRSPLYDGYANCMFLSAKHNVKAKDSPNPVSLIGPRKGADGKFPRLKPGELYGGCYVNALVRIYGYDGSRDGNPNRINCSLEVVQFKRAGDAFGAKPVDADAVMDEEEGEDAFDNGGATAGADADDPLG